MTRADPVTFAAGGDRVYSVCMRFGQLLLSCRDEASI